MDYPMGVSALVTLVAMGMGKVPPREGLKLCLLMALLLVPLDYLWFGLLGW